MKSLAKTDLTEFDTGRLFERRETRDQLIALTKITETDRLREILWAWLVDIMDHLPDEPMVVSIEETYIRFE